jgi:hypothetical protein
MVTYYVPENLRLQIPNVMDYPKHDYYEKRQLVEAIVAIHYAFYNHTDDFEMGLSLLDYMNKKITRYTDGQIAFLKEGIRQHRIGYMECIEELWSFADFHYYGL